MGDPISLSLHLLQTSQHHPQSSDLWPNIMEMYCFWVQSEDLISSQFFPLFLPSSLFPFALFLLSHHSPCSNSFLCLSFHLEVGEKGYRIGHLSPGEKRRPSSLNFKTRREKRPHCGLLTQSFFFFFSFTTVQHSDSLIAGGS